MDDLLLALDFGGTKLSAAVGRPGLSAWLAQDRRASPPGSSAEDDLRNITELARTVLAGEHPAAIGASFGGPVDFSSGVVRLSHHVPGWEDIPLKAWLNGAFDAPATVDNDANVAALGEWRYGHGAMASSLLYVTVSTGVGGGWILDGRPWRGHESLAGEIGHTVVEPEGPLCLCGKRGCVERLASGPYMAGDAREALVADPSRGEILRRMAGGTASQMDGRLLARAAEAGDGVAIQILTRGARALGTGLGNAINLVNPERIVIGGGVAKSGPVFWEALTATVRQVALPEVSYQLLPARFMDDAPLWGALELAAELLKQR